jgi:hypothetical protein
MHNKKYKEYFDKWLKEKIDSKCKICGEKTIFISIKYGYKNYCCRKCLFELIKESNLKKYGVSSHLKLDSIRNKIKQTNKERYGVENVFSSKTIMDKIKKNMEMKILLERIQ